VRLGLFHKLAWVIFFLAGHTTILCAQDAGKPSIVFAASSLTDVLKEHATNWGKTSNSTKPRFSFGASATMARQIEAGAPAHLFISANPKWSGHLKRQGLAQQLVTIASNQLVLVAPSGTPPPVHFEPTQDHFTKLLKGGRLVLANPATAPAGEYALNFLQQSGLWDTLNQHIAYAQNVRQALRLTERGGLPAFVYNSDAKANDAVNIVYVVPEGATAPILYQAALLQNSNDTTAAFLNFLRSTDATPTWKKYGFGKIASN